MEIQILDDNHPSYAKLDFYQYTGSIYHVVAPTQRAGKPAGQWNSMDDPRRRAGMWWSSSTARRSWTPTWTTT